MLATLSRSDKPLERPTLSHVALLFPFFSWEKMKRLNEIESEGWFKLIGAEWCRISGSETPVGSLQGALSSTPSTSRKINGIIVRVLCSINGCFWKLELFRVSLKASLSSLPHLVFSPRICLQMPSHISILFLSICQKNEALAVVLMHIFMFLR